MVEESSAARMERDVAKLCNVMQRYARSMSTRNSSGECQAQPKTYVSQLDEILDQCSASLDVNFVQDALRDPTGDDSAEARNRTYIDRRFRTLLSTLQNLVRLDRAEEVTFHNRQLSCELEAVKVSNGDRCEVAMPQIRKECLGYDRAWYLEW